MLLDLWWPSTAHSLPWQSSLRVAEEDMSSFLHCCNPQRFDAKAWAPRVHLVKVQLVNVLCAPS
jgi:hypothetical protein